MTHEEAVSFLAPAGPFRGEWADVGAGSGKFTRALAELIGAEGRVIALDRDAGAVTALERLARELPVTVLRGDMHDLSVLPLLDGVLFANVLHYTRKPEAVLRGAAGRLRDGGRIVVIEYDRRLPNPWVPYPISFTRLHEVAARAGLHHPVEVTRRASQYQREMYCAVLTPRADVPPSTRETR